MEDLWKDLWNNKPLLITVLAGVAVLLYLVYKNGAGGISSSPGTTSMPTTTSTGVEGTEIIQPAPVTILPIPATPGTPIPTTIGPHIRASSGTGYDANHTGVPLRSSPGYNGSVLATLPFGSLLSSLGTVTQGLGNVGPNTGPKTWYAYNGGYLSSADVSFS